MPQLKFPEITFRSLADGPPTMSLVPWRIIPQLALGRADFPEASVTMKLPFTTVPVSIMVLMPALMPEISLRVLALATPEASAPMMLPAPPKRFTPAPLPGLDVGEADQWTNCVPVASVPI